MCLVAHLCPTLCNPMDYSPPSSSVHRDSPGKEYFSGLPCLPPGDLPNPRVEPKADSLCLQCGRPRFDSWVWKIPWRRDRLPTPVFLSFPGGSAGKESTRNEETWGSITELGRSTGEGNSYPLQYSGPHNINLTKK